MPEHAALQIAPARSRTLLRLKSWLPEHTSGTMPVSIDGLELPSQMGAILHGPMQVLCVGGPGEWLIVSHEDASSLRERIAPDLPKHGLALVDLGDGLAVLDVRGSASGEVLSKACGLDLHQRSFPARQCARTRLAQIAVTIACLDGPPRFELYVSRSYLRYLHAWLTDAAAEFADS